MPSPKRSRGYSHATAIDINISQALKTLKTQRSPSLSTLTTKRSDESLAEFLETERQVQALEVTVQLQRPYPNLKIPRVPAHVLHIHKHRAFLERTCASRFSNGFALRAVFVAWKQSFRLAKQAL